MMVDSRDVRFVRVVDHARIENTMSGKSNGTSHERRLKFEEFEKRLVMSAQAVASVLSELEIAAPAIIQQVVSIDDSATTQASNIAAQYGLDGAGQTVAVIDSGIAWDHYALGSGFGEGSKVVGGWDFAENDANPYDDGPAGYHGTHVAGIIGSTDDQYRGVSSGVDLVSLRVFGDNGEGDLEWVEQALQWVHDHKDDFENPITTVNLSIGTSWNADSNPLWATMEDEFAQLEADGMFISVAAGNSFLTFGQPGLSYPAVSEHVVAVSSHDANGNLSDFAQRDEGVLVAPGESIRSTVPDHLFGGTSGGQFLGSTGTSMAAPYVAGASAVLRQANEFMGVTDVTQDMLYQQFRDTADQIYDSVTGGYYYQINLDAALASVIQDRYSGSIATATDAGTWRGGETIEGTIGKISDVDAFEFTAQYSGQLTLSIEVTDDLTPLVNVDGANATIHGNETTFNVVAGEKYNFSIATADGIGHYKMNVVFGSFNTGNNTGSTDGEANAETGEIINWGDVVSKQIFDQVIDGVSTFQLTTVRDGILTVESSIGADESLTIEVYDRQMNLVKAMTARDGEIRLDVNARTGETFFVKAIGQSASADFRLTNLVSIRSGSLTVHGTNKSDAIAISAENGFDINVNGVEYYFDQISVRDIRVIGHEGLDSIELSLGAENDRVNTRIERVSVANSRFRLNAFEFNSSSISGGGGYDVVSMIGSDGNDSLVAGVRGNTYSTMLSGFGFSANASGFELVHAVATNGFNTADLAGTLGHDLFVSRGERNWLKMRGTTLIVDGYESISVDGLGGNDSANLFDSVGNDRFVLNPRSATLSNIAYEINIEGIDRINAFSTSGIDSVTMYDTAGDEIFDHRDGISVLNGSGYTSFAQGFADVEVVSNGGNDFAQLYDTAGNDVFLGDAGDTEMRSNDLSVRTRGFKQVNLISNSGGQDRAFMKGTHGDDVVLVDAASSRLSMSNGRTNLVVGVADVEIDLLDGFDLSFITGSEGRERLEASYSEIELETTIQLLRMTNVERTQFEGNGGGDEISFEEMGELDLLESLGSEAIASFRNHTVVVDEFSILEASSVDDAIAQYDLEAVDFQYMLRGNWTEKSEK